MAGDAYDVIIVGAGPAGAQCARYLAEHSQYSVLLLDKTQEIGEPKKSTAGTFDETMRAFELPKRIAQCPITAGVFEGPTETATFPLKGCVLDFGRLKRFLAEDAVHHGVELRIESTAVKPVMEHKKIAGVLYRDLDGEHVAKAKIVIDATGPGAVLAAQIGLGKLDPKSHWIGMEFEMERLRLTQQNAMLIRLDTTFAPGGYSWIFSTGRNHAKVGNCWSRKLFGKHGGSGSQLSYLEKWIRSDARLKNGIALEMHAGDAYIDGIRTRSAHNFMAIGDVVCTVHPLFGEGIRPALYSGTFAAQAAIDALKKKDTSARQLAAYDHAWNGKYGKYWRTALLTNALLYRLSNKHLDKVVRNVGLLDPATRNRIINLTCTANDVRKLLPF